MMSHPKKGRVQRRGGACSTNHNQGEGVGQIMLMCRHSPRYTTDKLTYGLFNVSSPSAALAHHINYRDVFAGMRQMEAAIFSHIYLV